MTALVPTCGPTILGAVAEAICDRAFGIHSNTHECCPGLFYCNKALHETPENAVGLINCRYKFTNNNTVVEPLYGVSTFEAICFATQ